MLRILHIGCGSISGAWLSALVKRNDIEICGLVDLNLSAAEKRRNEYDLDCQVFTDINFALETTKPDAAIDNIVPTGRLKLAEQCLSMRVSVLSEKPLADSMENAAGIVSLSEKHGSEFFVMQNRRYNSGIFTFRNTIQSGKIGTIGYLGAEFFRDPHFGGFRDTMESPLLLDMAIHTFDQARFILGKDPVSVICKEFNPDWSWYKGNASAICIFTFEDGTVFNYSGSWCAPGLKTSWDSVWRASGSLGTCTWDGMGLPKASVNAGEGRHPAEKEILLEKSRCGPRGHEGCIDDMIRAIKSGTRAMTDCRDNIKSLAMVFAAIKSAKEGREVLIKEIMEEQS